MSKVMLFICLKKKENCQTFLGLLFHLYNKYKVEKYIACKKKLKCINLTIPGKPCYLFIYYLLLLNHNHAICQNLTYKSFIYVLASVLLIILLSYLFILLCWCCCCCSCFPVKYFNISSHFQYS